MSNRRTDEHRRFEIEGATLSYPMSFRDGSSMMGLFVVPSGPIDDLVASSGLRAAEICPGRSLFALNCVHYTDCGTYEEVVFSSFVRPPGSRTRVPYLNTLATAARGTVSSFAWRLAVTSVLSQQAGLQMWGFPKSVEDLTFERDGGQATMTWHCDGAEVLTFSMPDRGSRTPKPISPPVYGVLNDRLQVGKLTQATSGVGYHRRGVELSLGNHPAADELRSLGLPKRPLVGIWTEGLSFSMSAPTPDPRRARNARAFRWVPPVWLEIGSDSFPWPRQSR